MAIKSKANQISIYTGAIAVFLNQNGYRKKIIQSNTMETFSSSFIKGVLDNPIYCGELAFGRCKNEKIAGTRNEYHVVKQDSYLISEGIHDEIISERDWNLALIQKIWKKNIPT